MHRTTLSRRAKHCWLAATVAVATLAGLAVGTPVAAAPTSPPAGGVVEGRGVGEPVDGMRSVTDDEGNLHLRPISERLAFKSCKPLMRELAPGVPIRSWHVSDGWTEDFPTHATRHLLYDHEPVAGEPDHFLHCFMPGTYEPDAGGAESPDAVEAASVRARCAELARIDFRGWDVTTIDRHDGVTSAALLAPNGFAAGCVLGSDPRTPIVWIPERRPKGGDVVFVQFSDAVQATEVGLSGFAGRRVTHVVLTASSGEELEMTAAAGWFSGAGRLDGPIITGDLTVDAYDATGDQVWHKFFPLSVLPAECVASYEEEHGC